MEEKKIHTPALVLSIIGLVFCLISPIVTYIGCIVSLVMAIIKRENYKTKAIIIIDVIGLVLAVLNNVIAAIILLN